MTRLRPAQAKILAYEGGRMAISAVPGSGKTFTLALLAAQLIADGRIGVDDGQQVLIVTYLNSSVDTFRHRIRQRLEEIGLPPLGFDVRTLHSLALEIVRLENAATLADGDGLQVLDEVQRNLFLARAVDAYIEANESLWRSFLDDDSPLSRTRWRRITESTAASFIRTAKNGRHAPEQIRSALAGGARRASESDGDPLLTSVSQSPLLAMMAAIYGRYQAILSRQNALDFDDLIWQAVDLLEQRSGLVAELQKRWPFVLEDEAQDSVPLQEKLLTALTSGATGAGGNWVRVGDPNQAITSSFTAAHPRFFNDFLARPDVVSHPLPNSGRSAPLIFEAANTILDWVLDSHPVEEVRRHAFRRQHILATPPGDAQPNPRDEEASIKIRVYKHREDGELPAVARQALAYTRQRPEHTVAVLVPTNAVGHAVADLLDRLDADYDNLLRGGAREREIAGALHAVLSILAHPLDNRLLVAAYDSLQQLTHQALGEHELDEKHLTALLRSVARPETLLFPREGDDRRDALPAGVASEDEWRQIERFARFVAGLFDLRHLPVGDLALALADELFPAGEGSELDLSIAYQIANALAVWRDAQPDWRLPELVAQLADVASGKRTLTVASAGDAGYEPRPARISLATQHGAKGLEWDAVFLVGMDGHWLPGSLEASFYGVQSFLGGDPEAELTAQLRYLMAGDAGLFPDRTATETAHIEVICERLRLLYVGITRARRFLRLSRSRATRQYNRERDAEPATVLGVLYQYLVNDNSPH